MSAVAQEMTVESALRRAQAGEGEAFAELVGAHEAMVFSIALHCTSDRSRAEEIAQDVFLQLFRNLRSINSETHLAYWLRQVTSRRCIDLSRRWWQRVVPIEKVAEPRAAESWSDPLFDRKLQGLMAELPAQQRVVLTLRYQEDLGPAEIARIVAMPVNTVKSHLHRALEALRKGFGEP